MNRKTEDDELDKLLDEELIREAEMIERGLLSDGEDGVEPMSHVFPVQNVFREDVVTNGDDRENILKNAPGEKDGMFKVPKTFE